MSIRKGEKRGPQEDGSGVSGGVSAFPAKSPTRSWWRTLLAIGLLFGLSACLNCIGLNWGQPDAPPWQPDSIAGARTIHHTPNLFGQWRHKYPRFHFMVNAAAYEPFLNYWRKNPVKVPIDGGRRVGRSVLNTERMSILIMVSRIISALMGVGAVVAVFLTARLLFNDDLAAFLSGLALSFSMHFVFYNHLGNPDAPCTFWFAWGLYWAVKATYIGKWRHFILLGLFCSLAVCTKDAVAGYVVGLGFAMWLAMIGAALRADQGLRKAVLSIFSLKVFGAVLVFVLCFAVLNGFLRGPEEFFNRMGFWRAVPKREDVYFQGQLYLFKASVRCLYYGLGWPLLIMCVISVVYCGIKQRWELAFGVGPLLAFYLLVIMNVRFVVPRFLLAGYPGLALLVGKTCAEWLRWRKMPIMVKVFPLGFVYILSLLYCVGLDLELVDETRYRAEQWLASHVSRNDCVVALSSPAYAPRIQMAGCRYNFCNPRPKDEQVLNKIRPYSDYLVLGEKEFGAFDQVFLKALLAGKKGYKEVARFSGKYLYPKKTVFGFAGWPLKHVAVFSPEIIILKREQ